MDYLGGEEKGMLAPSQIIGGPGPLPPPPFPHTLPTPMFSSHVLSISTEELKCEGKIWIGCVTSEADLNIYCTYMISRQFTVHLYFLAHVHEGVRLI